MRAAALLLLTSATGATLWWGIASGSRGRNHQQSSSADEAGKAPVEGSPADASEYEIGARFHAVKAGTNAVLRSGDRLTPGDRLFLTIQASKPTYVYVVNQDEQGESYLMFPLPGQSLTDPLPGGEMHRLPGTQGGEEFYWQVTSAGGREHFFIFASPHQLEAFERFIAALPRPQLDKPVVGVQLSKQLIGTLRGVGGLAKTGAAPGGTASIGFAFATPLLEAVETARGFWAREIIFDNPGK